MTKDKFVAFVQHRQSRWQYKTFRLMLREMPSPRNVHKIWFELWLIGEPGFIRTDGHRFVKFSDEEKAKAALPKYQAWLEETGFVKKTFTTEQIAQRKADFDAMFGPESEWPAEQ